MPDFYTIMTAVGRAMEVNGHITGTPVQLTELAVGDGLNGAYYNPIDTQLALKNEVWRGSINQITTDPDNPNWIVVETLIPADVGPFFVREVGVFEAGGNLVAIGKYPETYKPVLAGGAAKDLYIRMILEVVNVASVTLKVDPAVVLATRDYADSLGTGWKASHIRRVNVSGPVLSTDRVVIVDATAAPVVLSLLSAASPFARSLTVIKEDAGDNAVTLQAQAGQTLPTGEGRQQAADLTIQDESIRIMPDGASHWHRIG